MMRGFFKVDELIDLHPKLVGLTGDAAWAFIRSLGHCSRLGTDGWIDSRAVRLICGHADDRDTVIGELEDAGLWEAVDGGWHVHDYLDHNLSAEERQRAARDGERGNHKRWHVDRGVTHPDCPLCTTDRGDSGTRSGGDRGGESQTKTKTKRRSSSARAREDAPLPELSTAPDDDDPPDGEHPTPHPTLRRDLTRVYGHHAVTEALGRAQQAGAKMPLAYAAKILANDAADRHARASPVDTAATYGQRMAAADVNLDDLAEAAAKRWPNLPDAQTAALTAFTQARDRPQLRAVGHDP